MSKLTMSLWLIFTGILFILTLFFNYTASTGIFSDKAVGDVSDDNSTYITPSGWTFSIWGFIYLWQAFWIIYMLYLTCKYEMHTILFGSWFYVAYNAGNILNITWILLFVNEILIGAAVVLPLITISLISAAFISHKYMYNVGHQQIEEAVRQQSYGGVDLNDKPDDDDDDGNKNEKATQISPVWLVESERIKNLIYISVVNGIPFYATWCTIATHLNIGIALVYEAGMTKIASSMLMLSILTCVILFYWFLDFGKKTREFLRYTYSPYIVLIVAFCGVLTNNDDTDNAAWIYTLILLIVAIIGSIAKIVMGFMLRDKSSTTANKTIETV